MSSSIDQSFDPQVLRRILVALLDTRDLMSIQLTYAEGLITESQFEELASPYLRIGTDLPDSELESQVTFLARLIPDRLTPELVSTLFACSLLQATRVCYKVAEVEAFSLSSES